MIYVLIRRTLDIYIVNTAQLQYRLFQIVG